MTNEEKQLLLKDLCARLPYGVKCYAYQSKIDGNDCECCGTFAGILYERFYLSDRIPINGGKTYDNYYLEVKPYLRPLSSMTETEKKSITEELYSMYNDNDSFESYGVEIMRINLRDGDAYNTNYSAIDLLNEHMLDYRGLIPQGLALEAKEGMYNFELERAKQ